MDDLLYHIQRSGGSRGTIKGARLSISGKDRDSLRIALREDADVGEFAAVAYSPKSRMLVIDKACETGSVMQVRRDKADERTAYPVIILNMGGETPVKFKTTHTAAVNCELKMLDDGRLAIPVPAQFEHVPGGEQ